MGINYPISETDIEWYQAERYQFEKENNKMIYNKDKTEVGSLPSGYYWGKYVDYPVYAVYFILDDKAYPCSPNRFASYHAVRDLRCIEEIQQPFELT